MQLEAQDLREAKQKLSCFKLKTLCVALKQYDNDDNTTSVEALARRCDMTPEAFLAHAEKAAYFYEAFDEGEPYTTVRENLRLKGLKQLRQKTILRLKTLEPEFKKKKKMPSLRFISVIGKEILKTSETFWYESKCSKSWAHEIRFELWPDSVSLTRGNFTKKFKPFYDWLDLHLERVQEVSNEEAKKQYINLVGPLKNQGAWSSISRRIRKRRGLSHSMRTTIVNEKKTKPLLALLELL